MESTLQTLLHRAGRSSLPRPHHRSPALSSLIWSLSSTTAQSFPSPSPSSSSLVSPSRSTLNGSRPRHTTRHGSLGQTRSYAKQSVKVRDVPEEMDEEEQLRSMSRMFANEHKLSLDLWAMKMDLLDVDLPPPVPRSVSPSAWGSFLLERFRNWTKNAVSLRTLAVEESIPHKPDASPWSWRILTTRSMGQKAWLAPLRAELLETYKAVNTAIAKGDTQTLQNLTRDDFLESALATARAQRQRVLNSAASSQRSGKPSNNQQAVPWKYEWAANESKDAVRIQSLRTTWGNMGSREPTYGNRYMVHLLATFKTEQTLHVYDRNNNLIPGLSQTEPKQVVEHLVFERRLWNRHPWMIRERFEY